ncbi:MBL fold metallo-hydrolase [Hanamia caeni]|jgi:L-ascorbate metabolism protein UlaG (beta-lactamase superfamily)|uniref:MBL fold metallo-hydrolase n=1 Tax=Hanamia caeni TaxID=2294116 RepID=A0A3M9NNJ8_9BACT|nr:MBL fold metallo-hydrolase [Hanamia caeni]RNI38907.1 MBL fold metallo-hydrolase [Hanamia caeni]
MILFLIISALLIIAIATFLNSPKFGKSPSGERLKRIQQSPNYKNGHFENVHSTPMMTAKGGMFTVLKQFLFDKKPGLIPSGVIPSVKTDLLHLDPREDVLVWFGHSSYFLQTDKMKILVDPVFSGSASPFSFNIKAFKGADIYTADDIPEIDILFLSHDHWDHLDYKTIVKLKPKIKRIVCALGVGELLEFWGFDKNKIYEADWNEQIDFGNGFVINSVTARHFSGRKFARNRSSWTSFILKTPTYKIFIGGDSGYDTHFRQIGKTFGPFDLAILENGQYNPNWKFIHMQPEETLQAAIDLQAKRLLPVHNSKFALSVHPWDEPLIRITELNKKMNINVATPRIGEALNLKDDSQVFLKWWQTIK